jgi:beta-glucanase (GH16 family)
MNLLSIKKQMYFIAKSALLLLLSVAFFSCEEENNIIEQHNWQLVWEDDFAGSASQLPDKSKWVFDIGKGPGNDGWGNAELQYYTDRPENVSLDGNGNLAIIAKRESYAGSPYTSARITTKGLFQQAFGRFEARIKTPYGPGIWPAFWLLGSDIDVVGWPQCGEIDIMELRGQEPNIIGGAVHGPGYSGGSPVSKAYGFENKRFDTDYYVFAVEWGEDYINYFVDDVIYQQITPEDVSGEWVFDQPFYILLNVAVGGNYVGFPAAGTPFPQTMLVDYVRVYQDTNR